MGQPVASRNYERTTYSAVKSYMGRHEEIPLLRHRDTSVNDCAIFDVVLVLFVGTLGVCRVESGVMSLDGDDEGNFRLRNLA